MTRMGRLVSPWLLVPASLAVIVFRCGGSVEANSHLFDRDAASEADASAPQDDYRDITDPASWSFFDPNTLMPDAAFPSEAGSYGGAAFDGRYLYLAPSNPGFPRSVVARFDTQSRLTDTSSWTLFDLSTLSMGASGFVGAVFDGQYVYLVPSANAACDGLVVRYDAHAQFADPSSWSMFDTATLSADARCFAGGTFDGRFLYLAPIGASTTSGSIVTRYDTQSTFTAAGSWATFDTSALNQNARGFFGAVFDGRYVYLAPSEEPQSIVVRYDTQATFEDVGAWSSFDTTSVSASARGFMGAAFDGQYVYLVPNHNSNGSSTLPPSDGVVARYDTHATFAASGSWSTFDTTSVNPNAKGFETAAFDGRYLYLLPNNNDWPHNGVVARYDTRSDFNGRGSWTTIDLATLYPTTLGTGGSLGRGADFYLGAAFDGHYLYLVPWGGGSVLARFEARDPPATPTLPQWHGSFF